MANLWMRVEFNQPWTFKSLLLLSKVFVRITHTMPPGWFMRWTMRRARYRIGEGPWRSCGERR